MTYCAGILTRDGLVMVADTRTNAGLDNVATFRKLHLFEVPGKKIFAIATAGNLGFTQSVLSMLREGLPRPDGSVARLIEQPTMFQAAQLVGEVIRHLYRSEGLAIEQHGAALDVSMVLAGQIEGQSQRLFMLYKAGNFIEATSDTPYLQIGEHKYGKPILDRAVTFNSDLYEALKLALISMDSTMRSNLGVGLPIDVLVLRRDVLTPEVAHRIEAGEPYFHDLRERWSAALRKAHSEIAPPPYGPKSV